MTVPSAGLMKFRRDRMVVLPPLSRQLTTSARGFRTGSTPATVKPWRSVGTRASDVPPCTPHVGLANEGPTAVGTTCLSWPPTWNCPAMLTHCARATEGTAQKMAKTKTPTGTTIVRRRALRLIDLPLGLVRASEFGAHG